MTGVIILAVIGAVLAGLGLLFFGVALCEKQFLKEYVPADFNLLPEPSAYFLEMNRVARELGFEYAGAFKQERANRMYQAYMACWVSPDHSTLARIGAGKTMGVAIRRTGLASYFPDSRLLETTDEFGTHDLSGVTDRKIVVNAGLWELWQVHRQRLAAEQAAPHAFRADNVLGVHETMQGLKASRLEKMGLAHFINPERTVFRYTVRGAWLTCTKGMLVQSRQGREQAFRAEIKRPGDA
jgi:hypothetical protein